MSASDVTEGPVVKAVLEFLNSCGGVIAWRNRAGGVRKGGRYYQFGLETGSSDIVAIVQPHGRALFLECKRPKGGKEEEAQRRFLTRVHAVGAVGGFCRSVDDAARLLDLARKPWA